MITVVTITLENEMDLVLAHKRSMRLAEKLGLTMATQTTFATAVSEIARTVIEHTDEGILHIGLEQNKMRYSLMATVTFDSDIHFTNADAGFYYAQKLVPEFELTEVETANIITMKIGLPRSLKLDPVKIIVLKKDFDEDQPLNAYEEIKHRNAILNQLASEKEEELRRSKLVDEKKTEFISIASHELKTPMTVLRAYTQIAKTTKEQISEPLREILNKIDFQSIKLLTLVQQLLDISKIEKGNLQYQMQETSLNEFITRQIDVMEHIWPHHTFMTNFCKDVDVSIDELRMEQVFNNLLGNAGKYSERNSQIIVSTTIKENDVVISVADQGRGMSEETRASVFDKFYRAKDVLKTHTGLGMGLYITSKIVNDHNGKIWVESDQEKGSIFHFTIPLVTNS